MHLPKRVDSIIRGGWVRAAAGGVTPSQHCQCERRERGNRTFWVVDERNSACAPGEMATCDQATGACACTLIMPVARPRRYD
jgi:hypothetical protein